MEFARFDMAQSWGKKKERRGTAWSRAGSPLIMKNTVEHVPDAGSYALPVTILIDERTHG